MADQVPVGRRPGEHVVVPPEDRRTAVDQQHPAGPQRRADPVCHHHQRAGPVGALIFESVLRWLAIAGALVASRTTGRLAVMDRYAVCQYARIRATGNPRWEPPARLAYRLFPSPDVTFLLTVRPTEAYRRVERRGTDHEELGHLTALDTAYRLLPESVDFVMIDANGSPDEVGAAILAYLDGRAGWGGPAVDPTEPPEPPEPAEP
ncbi:hypothetical protein ACFQ0D_26795, partial [Micromonospora zhanjiangensis]